MSQRCLGCMEQYEDEYKVCPHCGYVVGTTAEEAIHMEPGTILHDRYIVGKVLGYGGFGVTYIGWDGRLEQKVAIKEYLPGEFSTRMPGHSQVKVFGGEKSEQYHDGLVKFIEEARRLAKFQNEPGIVKIFDSFEENDTAYIVMEYLDGETLTSYMDREGTVPEDQAVQMLLPILDSLKTVHAEGILHRDIAPDNIFLTKDGEVKLIDFGASRYATTSHSRSLTVIIKPGYSPEEQYRSRGDQGPYTDVYALAATMYKMITGQTPPDAMERRAKYENQNKDILVSPHKLKKGISAIRENAILNAMNVRIEDRTPDVDTFISELTAKTPAKRKYGKIKKIDVYAWPTWTKVLLPSVLGIALLIGMLLVTGIVSFPTQYTQTIEVPENMVIVPNLEGLDKDEAIRIVESNCLQAKTGGTFSSEYVPAGYIALQDPVGGTYLEINGTISLTVSSGTGVLLPVNGISTMPYIIWDNEGEALEKLSLAGFAKPIIEYDYDKTVSSGQVISASLNNGDTVQEGTSITIVVSLGPAPYTWIGKSDVDGWDGVIEISAGYLHTVGRKEDGTVVAVGSNSLGQCNVEDWSDIVSISAGRLTTVGLREDGTVIATGLNTYGQCDVDNWTDIIYISAGENHTVGVKRDGTVLATGLNENGECNVRGWSNVIKVLAALNTTVGLKEDGTILLAGEYAKSVYDPYYRSGGFIETDDGWQDAREWRNIIEIASGEGFLIGLQADGHVVAVGKNNNGQCEVSDWANIVAIDANYNYAIGLKSDGTINSTFYWWYGNNTHSGDLFGRSIVKEWTGVKAIAAGDSHIVAILEDGRAIAAGDNAQGPCDGMDEWTAIVSISGNSTCTVGIRADGTVISTSKEHNVSEWTDVKKVCFRNFDIIALRNDGTLLSTNQSLQEELADWNDIVDIVQGVGQFSGPLIGLRENGTVVAYGANNYGECDVSEWTDIVAIAAGVDHTVGLKSDGTVVAVGDNKYGQCDVSALKNVKKIYAYGYTTAFIMGDGSADWIGYKYERGPWVVTPMISNNISSWSNIVDVVVGYGYIVGLKADGTVVGAGYNFFHHLDVSSWRNVERIFAGENVTIGLKDDGTLLFAGRNDFGQLNLSDWTDIISIQTINLHTIGLRSDGTVCAVGLSEVSYEGAPEDYTLIENSKKYR